MQCTIPCVARLRTNIDVHVRRRVPTPDSNATGVPPCEAAYMYGHGSGSLWIFSRENLPTSGYVVRSTNAVKPAAKYLAESLAGSYVLVEFVWPVETLPG